MQGDGYKTFLRATNKLAKGDVLVVQLTTEWHAYEPSLMYLLRKSSGVRKLVVHLPWTVRFWTLHFFFVSFQCVASTTYHWYYYDRGMDFPIMQAISCLFYKHVCLKLSRLKVHSEHGFVIRIAPFYFAQKRNPR